MKTKKVKEVLELNPTLYANIETGELLSDQEPGVSIKVTRDSDLVEIHYKEYILINSETLDFITDNKILGTADIGHLLKLADTVKTEYNALFKGNNTVHSVESLSKLLDMSYDRTRLFLDRLIKKGILYKFSGYRDDQPFKAYLMNPYVARKRKNVKKECVNLFQQFK